MTKVGFGPLAVATSVAIFASAADAAPVPGFHHPPNIVHPDNDFASRRSGGLMNEWMFRRDWLPAAQSYGAALSFANCVQKFSPTAAEANLKRSAADPEVRPELMNLVRRHRSCAREQAMVAPLLLRVAFAEIALRSTPGTVSAGQADVRPAMGVPERIEAFPVGAIAGCQVSAAPALVLNLLRTEPGGVAEESAAQALFAATPQCGSQGRGSITPTAARIAVVDAAFRRSR